MLQWDSAVLHWLVISSHRRSCLRRLTATHRNSFAEEGVARYRAVYRSLETG